MFPKDNMWKVALVSQNVQNLKKFTEGNARKFIVKFTCFGYADVIKYQEKPTISCEREDYYSSYHQRARGHKTIGSHLNFGA